MYFDLRFAWGKAAPVYASQLVERIHGVRLWSEGLLELLVAEVVEGHPLPGTIELPSTTTALTLSGEDLSTLDSRLCNNVHLDVFAIVPSPSQNDSGTGVSG